MKKILLALLVLFVVCSNSIFATTGDVFCHTSLAYNDGLLEMDNYSYSLHPYTHNDGSDDWAIYADGDLTIDLTGTNIIDEYGIYIGGNLTITGSGTLEVCKLVIDGESFISSAQITVDDYTGPKASYPMSVFSLVGGKHFAFYNLGTGTYSNEEGVPFSKITFFPTSEMAEPINVTDVTPLYKYNNSTLDWSDAKENVSGFVIYESNVGTTVDYDPTGALHDKDAPVYDVTFYDDLSSGEIKIKYIELVFDRSDWGKALGYQILSSTNAYEYQLVNDEPCFTPLVVGNTYYEIDGLIAERSLYKKPDSTYVGSTFFDFGITRNNSLSVKVIGETEHMYININVVDTHDYGDPDTEHNHGFVIPNTGVK